MILDRPPAGWKRPTLPCKARLQAVLNQGGKCKATGVRLGRVEDVHFDHRPALWERKFDTETQDTVPPANDPAFIEAITCDAHDKRTHGPGGERRITTRGSDSGNRAKDRAVIDRQAQHITAMASKGRGEPKPKKAGPKLRSRSSFPSGRKIPSRKSA